MQIAFVDYSSYDYTVETPYHRPMGGSQSAICYLAEQLAALGHGVRLFNHTAAASAWRGVTCAPLPGVSPADWKELDVVVVQNISKLGSRIKPLLRADAKLVLWTQHTAKQPAMQGLATPEFRDAHDIFVFVSDWQRREYAQVYGIDSARSHVLRNAIGPAFEASVSGEGDILSAKRQPPVLAYTSTPFRGLNVLLGIFPFVRQALPGVTLRVYSSMKVYHVPADRDAASYGHLYDSCRATPGVEYIGSLPQPELARELASVSLLTYPNHFAETSCIAVMEAMASGCQVVTSDLGALPETTAGFGRLIRVDENWQRYAQEFLDATMQLLREAATEKEKVGARLSRQVAYFNEHCTWRVRALEWQACFG